MKTDMKKPKNTQATNLLLVFTNVLKDVLSDKAEG